MNLREICSRVEETARETGEFIMKESGVFDIRMIETKGLHDYVSYVDKGSEKMLVDSLSRILPSAGFMAEEGTSSKKGEKYCWVIDPLDGTTNFLHSLHPFAISIGLMEGDEIIAGVVHEAAGKETFTAWKKGGAWLNGNEIRVSETGKLADSLIATGFPYYDFDRLSEYMDCLTHLVKNTHGIRRLGSAAIDLAYVACGRFDVFFEYSLHPWDVAAGTILVREAGGVVSDFSGKMQGMSGYEIVATNNPVYSEMLEIIGKFNLNINK